jgi:hypothetical protein
MDHVLSRSVQLLHCQGAAAQERRRYIGGGSGGRSVYYRLRKKRYNLLGSDK